MLDPDVERVLADMAAAGGPPAHQLPVAEARAANEVASLRYGGAGEPVERAEDLELGDVPARVYWPAGHDGALLVWLHGGGWVFGSLRSFEPLCRALTNASGAAVACVDYRLAPEHPFPAALEDARRALRWALEHAGELGCDPARVAVGGDSAGANLATVAARHVPGARFQCLVYPVTDGALNTASYRECDIGCGLTAADMRRFFELYVGDTGADALQPDISPLRAPDLSALPPAFVLTASHDPLRDEGEAYAAALEQAGVPVTLRRYDGAVHGFFRWMAAAAIARRAVAEAGGAVREALRGGSSVTAGT